MKNTPESFEALVHIHFHLVNEISRLMEDINPEDRYPWGRLGVRIEQNPLIERIAQASAQMLIDTWKRNKRLTRADITEEIQHIIALFVNLGIAAMNKLRVDAIEEEQLKILLGKKSGFGSGPPSGGNA